MAEIRVFVGQAISCLADFESGNGLTFYGDENFLVTTRELAEQLHEMLRLPRNINQVLVPTPKGDRLQKLYVTCPITGVPVTVTVLRVKCCMR